MNEFAPVETSQDDMLTIDVHGLIVEIPGRDNVMVFERSLLSFLGSNLNSFESSLTYARGFH